MSSYIFMQQAYECLLDQKASHYIDYETTSFPQHLDVVQQDMLPITKVQVANEANANDFPHGDSSMILQQLTPPQSPPQFEAQQQQQLEVPLKQESKQLQYATDATATPAGAADGFNNWVPVSEIIRETQLVDDIVNMRAKELQLPWHQQYNDDCESQASSTLCSSSSSSSSSSPSPSSSFADADEDWLPGSNSSSPAHTISEEQLSTSTCSSAKAAKKRTRTYGRGVEDRKIRKKEQNKNAATRYRQKKKQEMEEVLGEEQKLLQANEALKRQLAERRNESRYLRQLIREFYKERKQ
ncbi:activating transcription factor of chaperone isoform X2 [Drosophila hydei]|uniref:Activating transcription factor of chaperone isoform X2 n=1 Tax=Drosophila hydei TaxID=7224 RepID=A0A6J1LJ10_DROHY|nr:activating transcription factor of chaperone isoform X2 [Drosophila hydei]